MAGLGSSVGNPQMTRPPGHSLLLHSLFVYSFANIEGAVLQQPQREMTIESEELTYILQILTKKLDARA
jgi:hypothetical protein